MQAAANIGATEQKLKIELLAAPGPLLNLTQTSLPPSFKLVPDTEKLGPNHDQPSFQEMLETMAGDDKLSSYAVIDMTDKVGQTGVPELRYSGVNDTTPRRIASLGKILPLYGLFQLRADVRYVHGLDSSLSLSDVAKKVRKAYSAWGAASATRPLIEELFTAAFELKADLARFETLGDSFTVIGNLAADPPMTMKSTRQNRVAPVKAAGNSILLEPKLASATSRATADHNVANELALQNALVGSAPTLELARLMAFFSDDSAAAILIEALGFDFLWKLSDRSGLFGDWPKLLPRDEKKAPPNAGLFLTADYWYGLPAKDPPHPGLVSIQEGTARAVAVFMARLALGRLVQAKRALGQPPEYDLYAHTLMREILGHHAILGVQPGGSISEAILFQFVQRGPQNATAKFDPQQPLVDYETGKVIVIDGAGNSSVGASPPPLATSDYDLYKLGYLTGPPIFCEANFVQGNCALAVGGTRRISMVLVGILNGTTNSQKLDAFGTKIFEMFQARYGLRGA